MATYSDLKMAIEEATAQGHGIHMVMRKSTSKGSITRYLVASGPLNNVEMDKFHGVIADIVRDYLMRELLKSYTFMTVEEANSLLLAEPQTLGESA